jgi:hypothetical protein
MASLFYDERNYCYGTTVPITHLHVPSFLLAEELLPIIIAVAAR